MTDDPIGECSEAVPDFRCRVTATAETLVRVRRALAGWLADLPMSTEQQEDVVLASYEAMANSAEHGYRDLPGGPVDVHAHCDGTRLTVTVTDYGRWKRPDPSDNLRGRGLLMINGLAHVSRLDHRGNGTTVTMSWRPDLRPD